jgi:hypothetical protein
MGKHQGQSEFIDIALHWVIGSSMIFTKRLTIPTADGDLLHYSAVASEPLESPSKALAAEVPATSCMRRAAALEGLGLELWG